MLYYVCTIRTLCNVQFQVISRNKIPLYVYHEIKYFCQQQIIVSGRFLNNQSIQRFIIFLLPSMRIEYLCMTLCSPHEFCLLDNFYCIYVFSFTFLKRFIFPLILCLSQSTNTSYFCVFENVVVIVFPSDAAAAVFFSNINLSFLFYLFHLLSSAAKQIICTTNVSNANECCSKKMFGLHFFSP